MRTLFLGVFLSWNAALVVGQSFIGQADLPIVDDDGFYRIVISPDVAVPLNSQCTNIRIIDGGGKEVPYLLQTGRPRNSVPQFKEYEITEKRYEDGCCTTLVLHNPSQSMLNNINLVIKNAEVTKHAELLGSDDKEHWYALKQRFFMTPVNSSAGTSEVKIVDFPLSNYKFYALRIEDSTSAPLNILSAGYFENQVEEGKYTIVTNPTITKVDSISLKASFVRISFDTVRLIDKLELSLTGLPFFLRRATLFEPVERSLQKGRKEYVNDFVQEVELASTRATVIKFGAGRKVKEFLLVIENEDNPALEIGECKAYQLDRYLTAFLKKSEGYHIKFGGETLPAPVYDISFFKENIPASLPLLTVGKVSPSINAEVGAGYTFFTTRAFIWVAVILVIGILAYMSIRMLNESDTGDRKSN